MALFWIGFVVGFFLATPGAMAALLLLQNSRARRDQDGCKLYPDPLPEARWHEPGIAEIDIDDLAPQMEEGDEPTSRLERRDLYSSADTGYTPCE